MPEMIQRKKQQSHAIREQLRIGKELADALPQEMSQSEVAKNLGICQQAVSRTERLALYKVAARLRAALQEN